MTGAPAPQAEASEASRKCVFCPSTMPAYALNGIPVCAHCAGQIAGVHSKSIAAAHGVRAADPATLFRPGRRA